MRRIFVGMLEIIFNKKLAYFIKKYVVAALSFSGAGAVMQGELYFVLPPPSSPQYLHPA